MAYTTQQLLDIYQRANGGVAANAASKLAIDAWASQTAQGGLTDDAALSRTLALTNDTTAVVAATYQFFTGKAPSEAGLTYFLNSSTNANDLNDASGLYAGFNQESRFINFAINLAMGSSSAATFASNYGTGVTYQQTVATAYDKIIGNSVATAKGIDVSAAVAYLSRQANVDALTQFVKSNNPTFTTTQVELAVKAALIGEILNIAVSTGIGGYAAAVSAFTKDYSDDGHIVGNTDAGVDIIAAYPSTGTPGSTFNLTTAIDTLVGTANNDTFNGTVTGTADSVTLLDSIDGGNGIDTLNLSDATASTMTTANLTVKNVETLNLTSVAGLKGGALDVSGWTGLTQANVALAAPAAGQTVTAATTTGVALTAQAVGANTLTVQGGAAVTVTSTGGTTGTITVGSVTAPTGDVKVTATSGAYADADVTLGAISVKGGSSVTVSQSAGITTAQSTAAASDATNNTVTLGAITVTGTAATKSVTVSQDANVTAVNAAGGPPLTGGKIGITAGAVTITDVNSADNTKAGVISSVSITNGTSATINSNALTSLTVNAATGVAITANVANATVSKSLTIVGAGGTSAVTDTNNEITSLTVNATSASTLSFVDSGLTALTVSGAKLLTFNGANANNASLKTVTVTGAGGLTADLSGAALKNSLTKVDTTGSTGTSAISIDASGTAKTAYAGGAGVDSVTIVGAVASGASIVLGGGNDRLLSNGGSVTTSTTTVIDGGDGTDAVASSLVTAGNASMFKNFEVVNLSNTASSTFDVALLTGSTITGLEINGGTGKGQYANVALTQGTTVTAAAAANDAQLAFTGAAGTSDSYTVTFAATGATTSTATAPTAIDAGILRTALVENLNIVSGAASGFTKNTISLADVNAKTLTVTGSQAAAISFTATAFDGVTATTFGTAGANGFSAFDASAASGAITLNTANIGSATGGFTIKTGSGADVITLAAGQDTIITTGAGKDSVVATAVLGVAGTYNTASAAAHTTIMDLSAGDSITFVDHGTETFTATKVNVDAVANFSAALDAAAAGNGGANGIITWFQYGGNTYIVNDNDAGATFNVASDVVVKLNGLVDLSTATNSASHVLTLN